MQSVLAGRYRLERQLGKGGMGSVWLAEHLALRSWVAVKLMDPAIAATPEGAERFRREAQAAASLRSAHVVQVLDYGVHETTPYLVMELLHGESLAGCLEREKRLSPERTVAILIQVARALGRAHAAGIVHRDLKPDNVFLVREDDQELVKILDFGIAKTPPSKFGGLDTRTGVTMGTPYYMSPEQMEGKKAVDFRTDLWAMAVISCECMSGVRPFDGSTFGELLLNICARPIPPPSSQGLQLRGFDEWFAKATSRDPEQRFASAQELASTLKDVVASASSAAFVPPVPVPAPTAMMPAPTVSGPAVSGQAFVPALTGAPHLVPGAARSRPRALPWIILLTAILVASAGVAIVLLLRPKSGDGAESIASATSRTEAASPAAAPSVNATVPEPATPVSPAAPTSASPAAPPRAAAEPHSTSKLVPLQPGAVDKPATAVPATAPAPVPVSPLPAPPTAPTTKAVRCFSDPFSGLVRPAGAGQPAGAGTFACKQDPFTGKYKRL